VLGSAAALSAVDHVLLRTRPQREDAVAKVRKTIGDPTEGAPTEKGP